MRYLVLILCILVSAPVLMYGQSSLTKTGTTVASYLNIDVGSRAIGMGGSFVSVSDDVSALYWNPAGIGRLAGNRVMFCHTKWIADIDLNFVGMTVTVPVLGVIGAQARFLSMDRMERTTVDYPDGDGEFFDAGSYIIGLSYGRELTDRFSIGGSFKYIHEQIYHSSASAVAFDIGTLFRTQFRGLSIGMCISNYGSKMQMDGKDLLVQIRTDDRFAGTSDNTNAVLKTESFDLPLMFRFGVSMDVLEGDARNDVVVSVDALHPNNSSESMNVGVEYVYNRIFALRAGYNSLFNEEVNTGLSLGAGLSYRIAGTRMRFDYGYQEFHELLEAQMFTVGIDF